MKNFKKLMMLATMTLINQQFIVAEYEEKETQLEEKPAKKRRKENKEEKHQGFGRIWTAAENTLTLHPGNAVNALATGDQDDTTFGYERNDEGHVKARKADTHRNRKNEKKEHEKNKKAHEKKNKAKKDKASKSSKKSHAKKESAE